MTLLRQTRDFLANVRFVRVACCHKASVCAVQGYVRSWGKADLPVGRPDFSVWPI